MIFIAFLCVLCASVVYSNYLFPYLSYPNSPTFSGSMASFFWRGLKRST